MDDSLFLPSNLWTALLILWTTRLEISNQQLNPLHNRRSVRKVHILLAVNLKKMAPNLAQLEQWVSISIDDINSEIEELISKLIVP